MFFQHVGFSQIHKKGLARRWQVLRSDCCVPKAYSRTHATHSSCACEWAEQCVCLHSAQVLVRVWAHSRMHAHSLPLLSLSLNSALFHRLALQAERRGSSSSLRVIFSCWLAAFWGCFFFCTNTSFLSFSLLKNNNNNKKSFNLHQIRLASKCWYFCPKWLTEICTFIIKCDSKPVRSFVLNRGLWRKRGLLILLFMSDPERGKEWGPGWAGAAGCRGP